MDEERMTAEQFDERSKALLDKVEDKVTAIVSQNQSEMLQEVFVITDKISGIDKRMERMEHVVVGIKDDPNNPGIVHRCVKHGDRIEVLENYVHSQTEKDKSKEIKEDRKFKKHSANVVIWVALIGLAGTLATSTVTTMLVSKALFDKKIEEVRSSKP